jgi:hypothetical protein
MRPEHRALLLCLTPFPFAILITFATLLIVGERLPRQLAPGEGLWLPALGPTVVVGALIYRSASAGWADLRVRRFLMMVCAATSLVAWPVWTFGPMPTINGARLGAPQSTTMRLAKLETTTVKHQRGLHPWARLEPVADASPLRQGRYFLQPATHARWSEAKPPTVAVDHAPGWLGAHVVLDLH